MVQCQVVQNILSCTGSNRIVLQFCSINGAPAVNCTGVFDIGSLGLPSGEYNLTVFVTDVFQQTVDIFLTTTFTASGIYQTSCITNNYCHCCGCPTDNREQLYL